MLVTVANTQLLINMHIVSDKWLVQTIVVYNKLHVFGINLQCKLLFLFAFYKSWCRICSVQKSSPADIFDVSQFSTSKAQPGKVYDK